MTDQDEQTKAEIIPAPVVMPAVTPKEALRAWRLHQDLKQSLLDDADYQLIAGKPFTKKSGFRKIAVAYNLSDRIIEQERIEREDGSFTWRIVVETEAPNGRVCTGVGICDSRERSFAHIEHDVYSTCHTRAKNRAISDMVAGGVISAEEIERPNTMPPDPPKEVKKKPPPKKSTSLMPPSVVDEKPVEKPSKESVPSEEIPTSTENIIDILQSTGLETDILKISMTDEKTIIRSTGFMGKSLQAKYSSALKKIGFKYVEDGKRSRWESDSI